MRPRPVDALVPHFPDGADDEFLPFPVDEGNTVARFEHTSRWPPPAEAEASLKAMAQAAATWERLERAHPSLAEQIPAFCVSPTAKLMFVLASRKLSTLTGPVRVPLGPSDAVIRTSAGGIELQAAGVTVAKLGDAEGDFARLLLGAQKHAVAGNGPFDRTPTSLEAFLSGAVFHFYSNPAFTGGGQALSQRGGQAFRYTTLEQVLVSDNPSQRGFECLASAAFHLYLSVGLVPPDASREELEHRYTVIHGGQVRDAPRLGPEWSRSLRGGPARNSSERRLDAEATAAFANQLRETDWAKLTGASTGRYAVRSIGTLDGLVQHFANGGAGVRTTWANGGHYFVLTGATWEQGGLTVDQDDSLRRSSAPRTPGNPRPHRVMYDPLQHTRFWTLARVGGRSNSSGARFDR
jgi:hypothetical protein